MARERWRKNNEIMHMAFNEQWWNLCPKAMATIQSNELLHLHWSKNSFIVHGPCQYGFKVPHAFHILEYSWASRRWPQAILGSPEPDEQSNLDFPLTLDSLENKPDL